MSLHYCALLKVAPEKFFSKIVNTYPGSEQEKAKILFTLFSILPIVYVIIVCASLISEDMPVVYLVVGLFLITMISRGLLLAGKFRHSLQFFIIFLIFTLTALCTMGQGIHDITVITFPPLIVFSGQLLNKKDQIITSTLIFISIIWLTLGEKYGLFQPVPSSGLFTELVVIATVLVMSTLITYKIAKGLRATLTKTQTEIERSKLRTDEFEKILAAKSKLTNTVHGRIAESLSILREILRHQSGNQATRSFTESLSTQIEAISLIHKRLHENESLKYIDLNDYLRSLVLAYIDEPSWQDVSIKCEKGIQLDIEQAMSLGLYLFETISHSQPETSIEIVVHPNGSQLKIQLAFAHALTTTKSTLAEIMVQQMNGSVTLKEESGLIELEFSLQKRAK